MREHQDMLRTTINDQDKMSAVNGTINRQINKEVAEVLAQTEQSDGITSDTLRIIENSLERIVDDKLSNVISRINESNKTYAENLRSAHREEIAGSTAGKNTTQDFRRTVIDTRNEMITREKEREVRASNSIIHGTEEKGENFEDIKKNDSQIIKLFLKKVEVGCNLKITLIWVNPTQKRKDH